MSTKRACLHVLYVVVALTSISISADGINQQIVNCNNGTTVPTISIASNTIYSLSNCTFIVRFVMPTGVANASIAAIGGSALPSIFIDDNASISDINISVTNVTSDARSSPVEGILWANGFLSNSLNLTVSRLVLEVSNCRIAYSANGMLFYLSIKTILQLSFRLWNTTIEANFVMDGNNVFSVAEIRLTAGGALHLASMTVLYSTIVITVTRCTVAGCYPSPLVAAILFQSSTAGMINNLNITVINTATTIALLNTNASFTTEEVDLVAIVGTTGAPSQFHGVTVTVENSTTNMTGNEVVVVSFVKCGVLNVVAVTVRNVTLVGKMIASQSIGINKGAILAATIGIFCSFSLIVISHVTMTMTIQVAPLAVVSITSLAALVAILSPNISSTHAQIHNTSVAVSVVNVPLSLPASTFSMPKMRFSIVLLLRTTNVSSLQQTTIFVDQTHLSLSVPALTASAAANTFLLMEHTLISSDIPSATALQISVTGSTLNSSLQSGLVQFSPLSSADVIVAVVALSDPAMIPFGRFYSHFASLVSLLVAGGVSPGAPTSHSSSTISLVECQLSISLPLPSTSIPLFYSLATISLPSVAVAFSATIIDVVLNASTVALPVAIVQCAMGCNVNNKSNITVQSARSQSQSALAAFTTSTTTSSLIPLFVVEDSTIAFLAVTTNDAKYAVWNTSAFLSEVRGASVVRIDGCTFKNTTTPIFGNAVLWTQVGNKRPRVSLGCNQRSEPTASALFRTVVPADVLGRTTSDVVGSPIITFGAAGDTTPFSSPYLPHVVCNALQHSTITVSHLSPTKTTPPSSIATSTNILVTTVMFVQVSMPVSSVAATLIHSIQATIMIRRKRVACGEQTQTPETTSSNDDSENSLCCDFGTSPTQLTIGDENALLMRKLIGAMVGNTILVLGSSLLKGLVARVRGPHMPLFLQYVLGRPLGPIATVWGPLVTFLSPTLSAAVAIIFLPSTSSGFVPLGIVFICALSIPWVVSFYGLYWKRNQPYPLRGLPPKGRLQRNFKQKLLEPNELLDAPMAARRYAIQLLHSYGPVIEGYTARCYWYFNVETLFAFMNGIVMGLAYNESERNPCSMWTDWMLFALGVLEPTVALVVRPFAVLLDVVGLVLVVGLSTLSQLVMLVTSPNDAVADSVADVLALLSTVVEFLLVVFGLICVAVVGPSRWVHILTPSATDEIAPHASQSTASRYRLIVESTDAGQLPLRRQQHRKSASSSQRQSLAYLTEDQQHHALRELLRLIVEP